MRKTKKTPELILSRLKKLHEYLEKVKLTSQYQTYTDMVRESSLTTSEISVLINGGVITRHDAGGGSNRYVWNSIPPNIHTAERLLNEHKKSIKKAVVEEVVVEKSNGRKSLGNLIQAEYDDTNIYLIINRKALDYRIIDVENLLGYIESSL